MPIQPKSPANQVSELTHGNPSEMALKRLGSRKEMAIAEMDIDPKSIRFFGKMTHFGFSSRIPVCIIRRIRPTGAFRINGTKTSAEREI
jgi:hypothetical protein